MKPTKTQVTIRDIALKLGISHSTVSRALRDSDLISPVVREQVKQAARDLGYVADSAARTMRGEPSSLIGFVLPDVRTNFFSGLTTALGRACAARGYNLILSITQHDPAVEEAQILALRGARVAGILIYPTADLSPASAALLAKVRTVQVARRHPAITSAFVGSEDAASMSILVRHLLSLGHARIGFIGSDRRFSPGRERLDTFRASLSEAGNPIDEDLIWSGEASAHLGAVAAKKLLDLDHPPTALVVASAPMTEGVLDVIRRRGLRVPRDLSLTSFGDPFWYRSWGAGITTVVVPIDEIVEASLALLIGSKDANAPFEARPIDDVVRIPSHVVLRGTTGRPAWTTNAGR